MSALLERTLMKLAETHKLRSIVAVTANGESTQVFNIEVAPEEHRHDLITAANAVRNAAAQKREQQRREPCAR